MILVKILPLLFIASLSFAQETSSTMLFGFGKKKPKPPSQPPVRYAQTSTAVVTTTNTSWHFPAGSDSNSPLVWQGDTLIAFNSAGHPWRSQGGTLFELGKAERVEYINGNNGGRWMEAVIADPNQQGVLYGFYHNEPNIEDPTQQEKVGLCSTAVARPLEAEIDGIIDPNARRTVPRIGAAISLDSGVSWVDMGIILDVNPQLLLLGQQCLHSQNAYFIGGHGDFSVIADKNNQYVFIYFSNYTGLLQDQGIGVAYLNWSDLSAASEQVRRILSSPTRDQELSRINVHRTTIQAHKYITSGWNQPGLGGYVSAINPAFAAKRSWHEPVTDVYWGPSVHFNTYLNQYVMLLNHTVLSNASWKQESVYISFSDAIENPEGWSPPVKLYTGVNWYPQIVGAPSERGTDKEAGQQAYFFLGGNLLGQVRFFKAGEQLP
ncbi:MAG: hypothetical protein AB7F59_13260 [Bdellovibrionales bacterium]